MTRADQVAAAFLASDGMPWRAGRSGCSYGIAGRNGCPEGRDRPGQNCLFCPQCLARAASGSRGRGKLEPGQCHRVGSWAFPWSCGAMNGARHTSCPAPPPLPAPPVQARRYRRQVPAPGQCRRPSRPARHMIFQPSCSTREIRPVVGRGSGSCVRR